MDNFQVEQTTYPIYGAKHNCTFFLIILDI